MVRILSANAMRESNLLKFSFSLDVDTDWNPRLISNKLNSPVNVLLGIYLTLSGCFVLMRAEYAFLHYWPDTLLSFKTFLLRWICVFRWGINNPGKLSAVVLFTGLWGIQIVLWRRLPGSQPESRTILLWIWKFCWIKKSWLRFALPTVIV